MRVSVALCYELAILEQLDEHYARHETTHVRPHCNSGLAERISPAGQDLQCEPENQYEPCRHRNDAQEDQEEKECLNADVWIKDEISSHHTADRTGSTDNGNR